MARRACINFCLVLALLLAMPAGVASALEFPVAAGAEGTTRIDRARIRGLLESYLVARSDALPRARLRFKEIEKIKPLVLPAGTATCEIVPDHPAIVGSRRFTLIFRVDGRVEANLALRAELEALAPVAVAAVDLPRGAKLAPGDVRLAERDLTDLREPCLDADYPIGKSLRRSLRAGEPVRKGVLETPPVVRRGDLVTMTVRIGNLLLTARGAARENGVAGETIRVRNSSSQKEVLCRVVGPGEVEVEI